MRLMRRTTAFLDMPCSGSGIPAVEVPQIWNEAEVFLRPAIERSQGRYDIASVYAAIMERNMQLWCVWDGPMIAAVVTQVNIWPTGMRTARVILAGGSRIKEWVHMMDLIERWSRANDCRLLFADGRPGFKKLLGWETATIELVKDLSDAPRR
ncbi:hypothetical protein LCGC14_2169650 [marine sediment metagenome]|uniref:Uncharacterized protein n=1 Tax=marine sediment metagenome TaxID=412755 RepID=A0A0F9ECM8_9ZZZZ